MTLHYRETQNSTLLAPRLLTPTVKIARRQKSFYTSVGKRGLDLLLCAMLIPFALPLIALMALLVARDGGKPFYSQSRVGRNGKIYTMWKLRTMVHDADLQLETHLAENPDLRDEWNKDQKLKSDPRITRLGALLRRSSMDELPQLWNVVKGEMSLVGPRPMMPDQQTLYPGQEYYNLLPGITGSWQVSHRNESSFAERADFDTAYYQQMSFAEDIRIMASTVQVVLKATGY